MEKKKKSYEMFPKSPASPSPREAESGKKIRIKYGKGKSRGERTDGDGEDVYHEKKASGGSAKSRESC